MSLPESLPFLVAAGLLPAMLALMAAGDRAARRTGPPQSGPVDAAVLALLGLLLGFQFAGASNRLDARRQIVVREANAIGTAYLRIDLLPPEEQPPLRVLFRAYTAKRIDMVQAGGAEQAVAADAESRQMQNEIWTRAVAACRRAPSPATEMLVLPPLNDMFDVTTDRLTAAHTHTPLLVVALLLGVTLTSGFLVGSATSGSHRAWPLRALFAVVVVGTLYVTLDMEFPRVGLIRVWEADGAMAATLAGMK
ncbi:DUF4239 domain-containing protein [Gemmata sp.]|uniref:bestrophin-like domain n=1 Tax=Gemmata sp. TaxID=1914242 RepID=UPI003F703EFB